MAQLENTEAFRSSSPTSASETPLNRTVSFHSLQSEAGVVRRRNQSREGAQEKDGGEEQWTDSQKCY
jgi:hypothetical protein